MGIIQNSGVFVLLAEIFSKLCVHSIQDINCSCEILSSSETLSSLHPVPKIANQVFPADLRVISDCIFVFAFYMIGLSNDVQESALKLKIIVSNKLFAIVNSGHVTDGLQTSLCKLFRGS
jgi:hypothetical protein